jgi:surface protein
MFQYCTSLTSIPLFNTSSVTNMSSMFDGCTNVQSGALALYQQASTQTTPPSTHDQTFQNCGSSTTTGAAELAQIPSDWK